MDDDVGWMAMAFLSQELTTAEPRSDGVRRPQGDGRRAGRGPLMRCVLSVALIAAALPLAACSSSIADLPLIGVPEGAPARPKNPGEFPAVHDLPAPREQPAMDPSEQARIEGELAAARDRQAAQRAAQ